MFEKRRLLLFGFVICVLVVAALGVSKSFEERPFKIDGYVRLTIDLRTCGQVSCDAVIEDWGEATHTGRYYMNTHDLVFYVDQKIVGSGILKAANGDQLFYNRNDHDFSFTGGTGRFGNATGSFHIDHPPAAITMPNAYTVIAEHSYRGIGTVTY